MKETDSLIYFTLCSHHYEQVGVGSCEHRNVHGHTESVRLVQTDAKVSFSAQQQQDEDTDVHEAEPSCRHTQAERFYFVFKYSEQ